MELPHCRLHAKIKTCEASCCMTPCRGHKGPATSLYIHPREHWLLLLFLGARCNGENFASGAVGFWFWGFLSDNLLRLAMENHHLWIGECWAIYSISSQITSLILIVVTELQLLVILRTSPAKSCPAAFNFWSWNRSRCHRNCARRFWGRPAAHGAPKALRISALDCGWYNGIPRYARYNIVSIFFNLYNEICIYTVCIYILISLHNII